MRTIPPAPPAATRRAAALLSATLLVSAATRAADYYWDADGEATAGTGNSSNTLLNNWQAGAAYLAWRDGGATGALRSWGTLDAATLGTATAVFGGDLAGAVNVYGFYGLSVNGLRFERTGYTITSSPLTLVGTTPTITTNAGISATIASALQGTAGLVKAGAGYLTLEDANTYTGATTIAGGTLYLSNVGGTLDNTSAVTVNSGATLYFRAAERINNAAALTIAGGTLQLSSNATETVGAVTLSDSGTITGSSSSRLASSTSFELQSGTVNAMLVGASPAVGLNKSTSGTVTLTEQNTFTGKTTVSAGTLVLAYTGYNVRSNYALRNTSEVEIRTGGTVRLGPLGNQINDSATVNVAGGTFDLGSYGETVGGVTLDGGGLIKTGTLTSATTFDLRNGTVVAGLAGAAGLNKTTGGTVTLNLQPNNPYSYTGATHVTGGTLVVNGTFSTSAAETERVTVGTGARLTGAGTIVRPFTVEAGGTLAPGDPTASFGVLRTGSQTWADGSFAEFRLGNTSADRLTITGTLAAGNATIALTSFGFVAASLSDASWTLASTTGGITGLSNLALDTSALGAFDGSFALGLANSDTALVLSYTAVPEPATCGLLGGGAALGVAGLVRRRKTAATDRS